MMRNSSLLKWTQNNKSSNGKSGNRNWIHPPDTLQKGHIAYLVKFLGSTEVDQPKGIEVVKEGIRKLKFCQQLRKSEGSKTPKVELTISIDGVAIQDPKTKVIQHQYPLHRISYCADDKGEKKFFSFIAKESDADKHTCFVFVSDKLAEEITLTIGQAFELAYRRFLETSGKDLEVQRQLIILQQRLQRLETENTVLKQRLSDIAKIKGEDDVLAYTQQNGIADLLVVAAADDAETSSGTFSTTSSGSSSNGSSHHNGMLINNLSNGTAPPPIPPRAFEAKKSLGDELISDLMSVDAPTVGPRLQGLLLDELEDFNPRAPISPLAVNGMLINGNSHPSTPNGNTPLPILAPPPKPPRDSKRGPNSPDEGPAKDLFGSDPFNPFRDTSGMNTGADPFGMGDFSSSTTQPSAKDLESAIGFLDKRILEMKDGFSRGLSFGNEDFSLESLDPLRN